VRDSITTIKKNNENVSDAREEFDLEVAAEKTKLN
jgi:hypothetical protein